MKILVVDDNPVNQKFVEYSLRKLHNIDVANDGAEAVNKASNKAYDLIIMDLMMPIMDGAEATLRIRQFENNSERFTPIMVFTASTDEKDRDRCFEYGANDYITKPIEPSILQKKVSLFEK